MTNTDTQLKHCWSCDGTYPATTEYFHRDSSKSGGLHGSCKVCTRIRKQKWAKGNPEQVRLHAQRYAEGHPLPVSPPKINRKAENKRYIWSVKESGVCVGCTENRPEVLQFHHRDPETKTFAISEAKSRPLDEVKAETEKCDLMCGNCHLSLHYWENHG